MQNTFGIFGIISTRIMFARKLLYLSIHLLPPYVVCLVSNIRRAGLKIYTLKLYNEAKHIIHLLRVIPELISKSVFNIQIAFRENLPKLLYNQNIVIYYIIDILIVFPHTSIHFCSQILYAQELTGNWDFFHTNVWL